jgi:vacuolar-type H+-ATPase subunit H
MTNNKQQTAVDWFIEQLQKTRDWQRVINEVNQSSTSVRNVIEQAKAMHKEEVIKAYNESFRLRDKPYSTAIKYYNETFGGNNEEK